MPVIVHMVPYGGKAVFFNVLLRPSVGNDIQANVKRILRLQNQAVTSQELADEVLVTKKDLNKCVLIVKKSSLKDKLDKQK